MVAAADPRLTHIERLVASIDLPIGRWDREARLVYCNDHYLSWAARPREALLGHSLQELFGDAAWEAAAASFAQAFTGRTVRYQRQLLHGPTPGRWARIQVFPDTDASGAVEAVFTIATDIHEDVVAREALTLAQRRLDHFTDNIPYPLTYVDRDFVLRFVNKAYTEATNETRERLIGRHIGEVRGPRRWAEHEQIGRASCRERV